MSFAPPSSHEPARDENHEMDLDEYEEPKEYRPPPPPTEVTDDATGEDAYARRLRMSQQPPPPPATPPTAVPPPPTALAPPSTAVPPPTSVPPPPPPPSNIPPPPPGQITGAPVRYNLPPPPEDIPASAAELEEALTDEPKSSRPGQSGFAERLLSKYGWSKGQGLGAQGTGIINPLYAKADKRKKKSDAEGGGFATPAATGKILGGTKSKAEEQGKFGAMSEVIRLENMLDGMDLDEELRRDDGIMQEIGEECGEKYGSLERVYIHRQDSPLVFVQFVSQLSALRAVNALEGRVFGGNTIVARFWSTEKFKAAEYE